MLGLCPNQFKLKGSGISFVIAVALVCIACYIFIVVCFLFRKRVKVLIRFTVCLISLVNQFGWLLCVTLDIGTYLNSCMM